MKNGMIGALCILFSLSCMAQSHSFRFFPVSDSSLVPQYMNMAGQIGKKIVLFSRMNPKGLELYSYDTVSQTGTKHVYPFPRSGVFAIPRDGSVAFISASIEDSKLKYHYLEVNGNGDSLRSATDSLGLFGLRISLVTSPDQGHILYYQFTRLGNDSAVVLATMVGGNGQIEKTLNYAFKHDRERDDEPTMFVDNLGNSHILVYDKYNNYRLSTDLTINTIPKDEEAMISESFALNKIKLKTMQIFQDNRSGSLYAKGLYADGQLKTVRGMYNISFPIKRNNEMRQKFTEFPQDMVKAFRKNLSTSIRLVCDNLSVQDMVYTDSGTYAVFRLTGEPVVERRMAPRTIGGGSIIPDAGFALGPVALRADTWNAPKLVYIKINKDHNFEWHATKGQDVFRFSDSRYNRVQYGNDTKDIMTMMYLADKHDQPVPVVVTFRNGKPVVDRLPEKYMMFNSLQPLAREVYAAVYHDPGSGTGGIVVIHPTL